MKVASLSIGDELLLGEVVDTNAATIAAQLYGAGLRVSLHLTVGDNGPAITEACQILVQKADAVVVTGGLGPTVDDVTACSAARLSDSPLVLNEYARAHLQKFSEKVAGKLHPANDRQALIPAGAQVITNPIGTACGFSLTHDGCRLFFLPGVPVEMQRMLQDSVLPALIAADKDKKVLRSKVFKVSGIPEAELDVLLTGVMDDFPSASMAFRVNFPEIEVKIRVVADDEITAEKTVAETSDRARHRLKDWLFAEDADTIDTVVADLFRKKGVSLSLAESCTGGLLAKRITDISGCSAYFGQGAVTYSNEAKVQLLGVPQQLLEENGAVSPEVAMAMAQGVRTTSGSDLALAVTGIAGPTGGTPEKPVGTVYMAVADARGCCSKHFLFTGDRDQIRLITTFAALDWLRKELLSLP